MTFKPWILGVTAALALITAEAVKTPAEMLEDDGYPSEVFAVPTDDGYYIRLDRIPNPGRPAVFLANPLFGAGSAYLHMGADYSLGYLLYKAGFDVFIGSDRGTVFSRELAGTLGSTLSPESDDYFLFSWHESAVEDNPAYINTILELTGQSQVSYIGYSMGSTEFLAMVSERPELNARIRSAHLMAPVLALGEDTSHLYGLLHLYHNFTSNLLDALGLHKIPDSQLRDLVMTLCPNPTSCPLFNQLLYFIYDSNRTVDYVRNCPDLTTTWPEGGSFRQLLHYAQNSRYEGRFKRYDYGVRGNLATYGSVIPPDYKLENIRAPTHVYRGSGDKVSSRGDIQVISSRVPGLVEQWVHPVQGFSHADFVLDRAAVIVNRKIIEDLQLYS